MVRFCILAVLALALASCDQDAPSTSAATAAPAANPVRIPKIADASNADWVKQAHQVLILNPPDDAAGAHADLSVAWTSGALLLAAHTDDATPIETNDELWNGDCVGIVLDSSYGSDDKLEIVASPGRTAEHSEPRWHVYDKRPGAPALVPPEVHVTSDKAGYTLSISIPWANLSHPPHSGDIIAVQVYFNDAKDSAPLSHRTWYPGLQTSDPHQMVSLQLSDQADPPEIATARVHPKGFNDFAVAIQAIPSAAGKDVAIWSGDKQVASGKLAPGGFEGDSAADIALPVDLAAQKDAPLVITVDGQPLPAALKVPDLAALRLELVRSQPLAANSSVFDGSAFPKIDFLNKDLIQAAIGSYTLIPRFFDANWNPVTAPAAPGRYGALVDFRSQDGLACTRQFTLFKTAHPYNPAKDPYGATMKFPAAFGFPPALLANEQWNISDWTGDEMEYMATRDDWLASYLAGLKDLADNPGRLHGFTVGRANQDWWAELLKRQGADQEYPHLTYLPDGYDKDKKAWPLILFLHGSGSRGNDLGMVKDDGPLHYIHEGHPLPFVVVTPQCPSHEGWIAARLAHLLDEVAAANRIDPKRIYVTGLSMGGRGTWDLAATYPERFAAIAPVSGEENPAIAERLKNMPTWVFHGSEDTVVPTRYSLDIVSAMQGLGAPVKLTLYPGLGHGGWDMTYDNPALYSWFLQQSR